MALARGVLLALLLLRPAVLRHLVLVLGLVAGTWYSLDEAAHDWRAL